ncbi:MAG: class I SAM-dependent methyltransferase [Planctomycetota bacterium]
MGIVEHYRQQFAWRDWPTLLGALPSLEGARVLDLGCGVGDLSAELEARGARVLGIDGHEELVRAARTSLPSADFRVADLRRPLEVEGPVDGIWCSFTAAYFPKDLEPILASWISHLRTGGWIALTEVDDLFAHEPIGPETRGLLESYVQDGLAAGRYDFRMGRRLESALTEIGMTVTRAMTVPDQELAFDGPADPEVLEAWRRRLENMKLLHAHCDDRFEAVREDLLGCLTDDDHRSLTRVCFCLAVKPGEGPRRG